jgi:hypothetical protein
LPRGTIDTLVQREAYRVCPLLPLDSFVSFCRARKVSAHAERLRQLERLGLFLPLLRIYRINVTHKVELLDEGRRFRDLGQLGGSETWDGPVVTELAEFDFGRTVLRSWLEHGNAWDPCSATSIHAATIDTEPRRHRCYYSQFQIFELEHLLTALTATVEIEWALLEDGSIDPAWGDQLRSDLSQIAARTSRIMPTADIEVSAICQVISDRYYPKTQGDERQLTIPVGLSHFSDWDWYSFSRQWDAASVAGSLNLDGASLKRIYQRVFLRYRQTDPLENWRGLVRFVRTSKREKLKDDALKALAFGEMAKMLRLFYQDAFGEPLDIHEELGGTVIERIVSIEDDTLRALELVTNDFGLNPKPQLVLFVEGATELAVVPVLFDKLFATTPGVFGIELVNMRGVANATGGAESSYSALWRLIDYLHHHQTFAFVLLDNEGLAPVNIGKGLKRASSIHFPDRRVTRPNYVKLWKLSFEMDNFNDSELAKVLTRYADGQAKFTTADVKDCRNSANLQKKKVKLRTLDVLYTERVGRNLNKPRFGLMLVDFMCDPTTKRKPQHRPIVRFLENVAERAARNHQPVTQKIWEYNQRTGYFGTLRPGAVGRRKNPIGMSEPKRKQSK